jgi:penicillin G amidase
LYPGYYYPKARAGRLQTLLSEEKKWTVEEVKRMALDVVGEPQAETAKAIAAILAESNTAVAQQLAPVLQTWNGNHEENAVAPSVYYNLLSQMVFLTMKDELGETAFNSLMQTAVPKNSYLTLINNEQSPWWDNVNTPDVQEARLQIVETAAVNTLALLQKTSGSEAVDWQWQKIHTLTHNHPLGAVKPLDKFFSVGPYAVAGGQEVVNNLTFSLATTGYFPVTVGPALRKITDFSAIEQGVTVSPTGQSGNVMSKHYDDQAELFATGNFRPMLMNRKDIETRGTRLLLIPKE